MRGSGRGGGPPHGGRRALAHFPSLVSAENTSGLCFISGLKHGQNMQKHTREYGNSAPRRGSAKGPPPQGIYADNKGARRLQA